MPSSPLWRMTRNELRNEARSDFINLPSHPLRQTIAQLIEPPGYLTATKLTLITALEIMAWIKSSPTSGAR